MIYFTTEFEINLPTPNEKEVYLSKVYSQIEDFLGDLAYKYKNTFEIRYAEVKNKFTFKWNDSIYTGNETGEERVKAISRMLERSFRTNKFFKKHGIRSIATEYNIVDGK